MIDPQRHAKEIAEISKHSTTVVADAMNKFGSVPDLTLIADMPHDTKIAGPVYYVETYLESNWHLHEALEHAPENAVVVVEPIRCNKRAVFGEIVMDYIIQQRKAQGVVVNGYMRDIESIIAKRYPLWYKGNNPVGCFNKQVEKPDQQSIDEALQENRLYYDHPAKSICVADAAGVVIIPEGKIKDTYRRVQEIASLEKIWHACIKAGLSTYETVCHRAYEGKTEEAQRLIDGPRFKQIRQLYRDHQALLERLKEY